MVSPLSRFPVAPADARGKSVEALDTALDRFVERLRARLVAGASTYGNVSFQRPAAELVDEVQQELEDVCGWGLILWLRLERLRAHVEQLGGGDDGR